MNSGRISAVMAQNMSGQISSPSFLNALLLKWLRCSGSALVHRYPLQEGRSIHHWALKQIHLRLGPVLILGGRLAPHGDASGLLLLLWVLMLCSASEPKAELVFHLAAAGLAINAGLQADGQWLRVFKSTV